LGTIRDVQNWMPSLRRQLLFRWCIRNPRNPFAELPPIGCLTVEEKMKKMRRDSRIEAAVGTRAKR
jgi:hypothetical protein